MSDYIPIDQGSRILLNCNDDLGDRVFAGKLNGEHVAIKRLMPLECNRREVMVMVQLPKHKNTVHYITSYVTKNPPYWYIVMELCKRTNLHHLIKGNKTLVIKAKIIILFQLVEGLHHLHENSVTYGDLNPQNILLSRDGKNIKICDFGLSKEVSPKSESHTKSTTALGISGWSLGSHSGLGILSKSDIFSAELIFYYVLSNGEHAFGSVGKSMENFVEQSNTNLIPDWKLLENIIQDDDIYLLARNLIESMLARNLLDRPDLAKILKHPFFWHYARKADYLCRLRDIFRTSYAFQQCVEIQGHWRGSLCYSDSEKQFAGPLLEAMQTMADDLQSLDLIKKTIITILELCQKCVLDLKRNSSSPNTLFKSDKELWTFFSSKFPEVVLCGYEFDQTELPKIGPLCPEPGPVQEVNCELKEDSIHLAWVPPPEDVPRYTLLVKVDSILKETVDCHSPDYVIENVKYSVSYTFTVSAQNPEGMNGESATLDIITPPTSL